MTTFTPFRRMDDKKAGAKSMAVWLGEAIRPVLSSFSLAFFVCLLWAGYWNGQCLPFYVISALAPFLLCLWHIWSSNDSDPLDSWKKFMASRYALWSGDGLRWICRGPLHQTRIPSRLSRHFQCRDQFFGGLF
ncbi:hypothetical protein EDB19DRAFT_1242938 [Suillus lakei]|nr:hypothetical protein EDB19DRAFT_1242938 [Suillus lakei]